MRTFESLALLALEHGFQEPHQGKTQDEIFDEIRVRPTPRNFFERLFEHCCGEPIAREKTFEELARVPEDPQGIFVRVKSQAQSTISDGTAGVLILRWHTEGTSGDTVDYSWETFGLPGIFVRWRIGYEKYGQLGHCVGRDFSLLARFVDEDAHGLFAAVWHETFGTLPIFRQATTTDLTDDDPGRV